jgi:hypothetical protein
LVGREARRELEEALAHILGAEASPETTHTIDQHQLSSLTVAGLCFYSRTIRVSINMFSSSL